MVGQEAENAGGVEHAEPLERTAQQNAAPGHARRRVAERDEALAACGKSRRFWLDQIDRVSYT